MNYSSLEHGMRFNIGMTFGCSDSLGAPHLPFHLRYRNHADIFQPGSQWALLSFTITFVIGSTLYWCVTELDSRLYVQSTFKSFHLSAPVSSLLLEHPLWLPDILLPIRTFLRRSLRSTRCPIGRIWLVDRGIVDRISVKNRVLNGRISLMVVTGRRALRQVA